MGGFLIFNKNWNLTSPDVRWGLRGLQGLHGLTDNRLLNSVVINEAVNVLGKSNVFLMLQHFSALHTNCLHQLFKGCVMEAD